MTLSSSIRIVLLLTLCIWPWLTARAVQDNAESISADHVRIQWLAPNEFGPGLTTIGIYFEVDPHWHVYWRNAGDSGAAPRFAFNGQGVEVGAAQWPYPTRLPIAHLTNLGYEGNVAYLFEIIPAAGQQQIDLQVELEWLVCKEDCIPGFGQLRLQRSVGGATQWQASQQTLVEEFKARIPRPATDSPWQIIEGVWQADDSTLVVKVAGPANSAAAPELFPLDGELLTATKPETSTTPAGYEMRFTTLSGADMPASTGLVLVAQGEAWQFDTIPIRPAAVSNAANGQSLVVLLLLALIGGVLLNLMPCVFPVLSIKLFSLLQSSGPHASRERLHEGVLYSAGVLTTFALLGGIFLALRAGGAAIGWGFQLQSPIVVLGLALLFWLMALSFLGVFEFGHGVMNLAGRARGSSAFGTGILAVFVAAPCTGPFMGAALGASATLPAAQALAIFLGLGTGLALPFLVLAASPRLASALPRPGNWMITLRQFFAFPLFATVLWLLWVLGHLVGGDGWLVGAALLLMISFALWLGRSSRRSLVVSAWLVALLAITLVLPQLRGSAAVTPQQQAGHSAWQSYNGQLVSEARQRGQAVFIDFTAAWCITCQVNKKLVLDTAAANQLLDEHQVLRLRADWTRYDADITQALADLGRNSVPVYAFYPADGGAKTLLPQILTLEILRDLFEEPD